MTNLETLAWLYGTLVDKYDGVTLTTNQHHPGNLHLRVGRKVHIFYNVLTNNQIEIVFGHENYVFPSRKPKVILAEIIKAVETQPKIHS